MPMAKTVATRISEMRRSSRCSMNDISLLGLLRRMRVESMGLVLAEEVLDDVKAEARRNGV